MLTPDDDDEFKCPSDYCSFRAGTIKKVQLHCLQDCPEKLVYLDIKEKHDSRPKLFKSTNKRADIGRPVRFVADELLDVKDKLLGLVDDVRFSCSTRIFC